MTIDNVRIFDLGEDCIDRYTAIIWFDNYTKSEVLAFNNYPYTGFGQHCGEWKGGNDFSELGTEIEMTSLSAEAYEFVTDEINYIKKYEL